MQNSIERKWQKKWQEYGIFEPQPDREREKFFITVPWPYVNGSLHVGHGRTYTLADIIARYKRSVGYNVLFPMAFHQSGTPILAFSQRLRMGDSATIKQYRDYVLQYEEESVVEERLKSFQDPKNIADYFSKAVIRDFNSLGYSIDWTREFTSADKQYQDFVKWQFNKLNSIDLIKKGNYPVLYSVEDDNAVGEDDIKDGDIDKVSIEEFTGVIFSSEKFSLIAASLRPETIYGITNLWIGKSLDYVLFKYKSNSFAVTKESFEKLKLQIHEIEFVGDISHGEILSQKYKVPETNKKISVLETTFVDPDNGTGVVYSVPGHSIWDYVALDAKGRKKVPVIIDMPEKSEATVERLVQKMGIASVEEREKLIEATQSLYKEEFYNGRMKGECGIISGMKVSEGREKIKEILLENGGAIKVLETSRKAETRSGSKVVVAVLKDQWFIDYSPGWLKERAHELVNSMFYYPEFYRSAMNESVDWLRERPCARRRGLGTRLPFDDRWIIESLSDSTIYPAVYTNINELKGIYDELGELPENVVDYIFSDGPRLKGIPSNITALCEKAKTNFNYWYGVDVRLTAYPHLSNHLSFYIMNHAAIFDTVHQPGGLIISGLVVSNGAKISKSKGNVISLMSIANHYSADIYRLYVAIQADIQSTLDWNENDLKTVTRKYEALRELFEKSDLGDKSVPTQMDLWFLVRFRSRMKEFRKNMEGYNIRAAFISAFYEVLNDFRRLEARGGNTDFAIKSIAKEWLIALSTTVPHISEELWHTYVEDSFVSAALLEDSTDQIINDSFVSIKREILGIYSNKDVEAMETNIDLLSENVLSSEEYLQRIEGDIREIIKATGINPARIEISTCDKELTQAAEYLLENKKDKMTTDQKRLIPEFMKVRKNITNYAFDEHKLLSSNSEFLSKAFSANVEITKAGANPKGKNPWPGRPMIRLE